jgi:hypothetical protein
MADERYPRWRQRWDERAGDIDNEIKSWWQRTKADYRSADTPGEAMAGAVGETQRAGDRIGDRLAGRNDPETVAERVGDTGRNWWAGVKNTVADWFDDDDAETKAEYNQAWKDEDYITQRFDERKNELKRRGDLV